MELHSASLQSDGKILAAGNFTTFASSTRNYLTRLNADGIEDTAFYSNLGGGFDNYILITTLQSDGKILAAGNFTTFASSTRNRLVRLNTDGTEDAIFATNLGSGFNNLVRSVFLQSDGKILVGGAFTTFASSTRNRIVRLNTDGTEDTTFATNLGSGFNNAVRSAFLQPDGKIVVGGDFTTFASSTRNRLVRLNADGTEDTTFATNLGSGFNNLVRSVFLQSDGKILVGGAFTTFASSTRNYFTRLNADGTEDTTFATNLGSGFNSFILSSVLQSDGKILVGGVFTTFAGTTRNYFTRLNVSGTEDTTFGTNLGSGFNNTIVATALQSDGKILAAGTFTTFASSTRNYLTRLNADGIEDIDATPPVITITGSNPASVTVGSVYTDAGATALDAISVNVTSSITASSTVNTSVVGAYSVIYTARDTAGNFASSTRVVNVSNVVSSGGGGGGGGSYTPPTVTLPTVATSTVTVTPTTQIASTPALSSFDITAITKVLAPNTTDKEVLSLQRFLNTHGYPVVASGRGSLDNEITYMGPSTVKALKKFQKDNKIFANGYTGLSTRILINAMIAKDATTIPTALNP